MSHGGNRSTVRPRTGLTVAYVAHGDRSGSRPGVSGNTGHLVLWEQPERVAGDLTAFVEGRSG
ncbi:MAG TPA: hypothetical protein VFH03_22550 [Actinoplanes sp.]|nr:hypothetical protein [Actinoplanes sp.]